MPNPSDPAKLSSSQLYIKLQDALQGRTRWMSFSSTLQTHLRKCFNTTCYTSLTSFVFAHRLNHSYTKGNSLPRSTEADIFFGVPQGTVLRPLLFLAFINKLPESTTHSDARLSADDVCCGYSLESLHRGNSNEHPQHMFLWRTNENYPSFITKYPPICCTDVLRSQNSSLLQEDLSALLRWEEIWQMKFHLRNAQSLGSQHQQAADHQDSLPDLWPHTGYSRQQQILRRHYRGPPRGFGEQGHLLQGNMGTKV